MKHRVKKIHFVGIGGIGMSGIAELLLNLGYEVTGSDLRESPVIERLRGLGGKIVIGHRPENIESVDVTVISSAVKPDNPEVVAARYQGVPVIPRAEMLAELMRMKRGIAVAGSHGKTTITSMISAVLARAGLDPTAVIGGRLNIFGSNAKLGQGEWVVVEADESDGSCLHLTPTIVVVSNIDREHMDYYQTLDRLHSTFLELMNRVPFYGLVVAGADDPVVRSLIPGVKRRTLTYGSDDDCDMRAVEIRCRGLECEFTAVFEGRRLGHVTLGMPGVHNAINALAALAAAHELEIPFETAAQALNGFSGIGRRFEVKGEERGVMVIDDYGHHPTELRATLQAAREFVDTANRGGDSRLIAAFQPHRYSRTRDLWDEFLQAFSTPDLLFITEIYPAGEDPIPGFSAERLSRELAEERASRGQETRYVRDLSELAAALAREAKPGDVVLTLGAGSITRAGPDLLSLLKKEKP